jgi:hypothetical protein
MGQGFVAYSLSTKTNPKGLYSIKRHIPAKPSDIKAHLPGQETFRVSSGLNNTHKPQNNQDDGNHEQRVENIAGARKARVDAWAEVTEQPEYEQNDDDPGKHAIFPFFLSDFIPSSSYNKRPPATSISRGVLFSATWGMWQC